MHECGCKGVRTCRLCEDTKLSMAAESTEKSFCQLTFCGVCRRAHIFPSSSCETHSNGFILDGLTILPDFLSEDEETSLIKEIDRSPWVPSQSGRNKQDYGAKVNFKKKRVKLGCFTGLPAYSEFLVQRLHQRMRHSVTEGFSDFYPVELCNLEYLPERGAAILPHLDDSWLWGERIVLLNLVSATQMTFTLPSNGVGIDSCELIAERSAYTIFSKSHLPLPQSDLPPCIAVPLPPRCLLILAGRSRHIWLHAINRNDISCRRISLTLRELSTEYLPPMEYLRPFSEGGKICGQMDSENLLSPEQKTGFELIKLSAKYEGVCVATAAVAQPKVKL